MSRCQVCPYSPLLLLPFFTRIAEFFGVKVAEEFSKGDGVEGFGLMGIEGVRVYWILGTMVAGGFWYFKFEGF